MWEIFREIITSPAGSFGTVILFGLMCFWLINKVSIINNEHSHMTDLFKKHDEHIDEIRKNLAVIKGQLELLSKNSNDFAQSHSPVSLTEKGKEACNTLGVDVMVNDNWQNILKVLKDEVKDKNAYDIQQYCIETASAQLEKFLKPDDVTRMKIYAYQIGAPLPTLSIIVAIIIRDRYFAEKNIPIEDVDINCPTK